MAYKSDRSIAPPTPPPGAPLRVLIIANSHPKLTRGGAEISAHALFEAFNQTPDVEAFFLGAQSGGGGADRLGAPFTQPFGDREYIYTGGAFDWFKFANQDPNFPPAFTELLRELAPDIVHFQHFVMLGVEAIHLVRQALPDARILLTLHEYLAICNHYGQMVTRPRQSLCYEAAPLACAKCFPDLSPADFVLRKLYIERFFADVDFFLSPSRFLADRFIAWGLPPDRIDVLENVIAPARPSTTRLRPRTDGALRAGYFGQISPLKGIDVLFDTAALLEQAGDTGIVFEIHGDHRSQPPEFQEAFLKRLDKIGPNMHFHGPYDPSRVDDLMQAIDVTIMPSIWWENSPVVIQEAFRNGKPVICSDIGGMAEKVRDGIDGWHFQAGSAQALKSLLEHVRATRAVPERNDEEHSVVPTVDDIRDQHLELYRAVLGKAEQSEASEAARLGAAQTRQGPSPWTSPMVLEASAEAVALI